MKVGGKNFAQHGCHTNSLQHTGAAKRREGIPAVTFVS